ncbi:hypothetical protein [Paenibacillus polymyxa]|uniref:DUF3784 domain-containing protein n=1 Tax=Paenibacillus polymyxa (strain SC2) TaxID=886882 RepID=A0A0D5ZCG5_PAEPS|nr:hypothetical protein [Paenibacillus polymyxa]AKA44333.1 hypothetical protein PPSC2_25850 [Paenibacillus polymyxa SC2]WPQ59903.1 hypothetical protein SKN87_27045 [Paenibacillus polymyxa]
MLSLILSVIFTSILILDMRLHSREDKDERWDLIMQRPLTIAFLLLIIGYSAMNLLDIFLKFSFSAYRNGIDIIFTGVLVIYIIVLIIEKRKYS